MTADERKLVEVALPLEAINAACKRDKDTKTGTIRNLHKWFAPMPSPAWRAVLAAALIDDPGDTAQRSEIFASIEAALSDDPKLAAIGLAELRDLVSSTRNGVPVVLDPFCGGGSTLLEAQRLGLNAVGSDLNPIPVLISRVLTQYLPQEAGEAGIHDPGESLLHGDSSFAGFEADVRHYANRIRDAAWQILADYFPAAPNGDPVIAWWWARTVPSPDPRYHGRRTPLVTSWWLTKQKGLAAFVRPTVNTGSGTITFEIVDGNGPAPASSTKQCLYSGAPISFSYIKEQGKAGQLGLAMLALISHGASGRCHLAPSEVDESLAAAAVPRDPMSLPIPDKALGFTVQQYGIHDWNQVFTPRQALVLETFADQVNQVLDWAVEDGASEVYATALASVLGLCVGKLAQACSMQVRWRTRDGSAKAEPAFSRPDISPHWDFAEVNPFGGSVGDWLQVVETALRALDHVVPGGVPARVEQRDARVASALVDPASALVATDPPYFGNFGYADPSNYFYPWLRRALRRAHPDLFSTLGAPTSGELIADPSRFDGDKSRARDYFVDGLSETFSSLRSASRPDLPILVIYAYKQQETSEGGTVSTGWEAVLESLIRAGLAVTGTWPIHGTGTGRARGLSSNALATYVLLACRVRPDDAPIATFREFRIALQSELAGAVEAIRAAAIAPVDLAQAAVGPGMQVFTRYARVIQADGTAATVRLALSTINAALDQILEESEADFDSDTRWAVTWFAQYGFGPGPYGVADGLARAKNTGVNGLEEAGVAISSGGTVVLVSPGDLPAPWSPQEDARPTVWEATHHLSERLRNEGEQVAADLVRQLGGFGELARELAYRLHSIADKRGWSAEAQRYNELVVAWPEIARLAAVAPPFVAPEQQTLGG